METEAKRFYRTFPRRPFTSKRMLDTEDKSNVITIIKDCHFHPGTPVNASHPREPITKRPFPLWPVWQSTKERRPSLRGPFNQGARFVAVAVINAPRPPLIPTLYVIVVGIGRPNRGQMTVKIKCTIVIANHNERAITRRKGLGETEACTPPIFPMCIFNANYRSVELLNFRH